jgi:hypothetical protein
MVGRLSSGLSSQLSGVRDKPLSFDMESLDYSNFIIAVYGKNGQSRRVLLPA